MATVRISQVLRDEIIDNARNLFTDRKEQAKKNYNADWGKQIARQLYPDELRVKLNALDKDWFRQGTRIVLEGFINTPDEVIQKNYHSKIKYDVDTFFYPQHEIKKLAEANGYSASTNYEGLDIKLDATNPKWNEIQKEYKAYRQAIYDIDQEEDKIVSTIGKVLDNYSTLAPCIKALPEIYDLLPPHTKRRHNEVVEKTQRAKPEELDIDTKSLGVAMVKDKITKGGNK